VRREVREEVLETRRALLERAFEVALSPELRAEALALVRAGLGEDLARALACVDEADAVACCAPALVEAAREALGDGLVELRVAPGLEAGLQLASEGGRVEVDLRLASRVEAARPRAAVAALEAFDGAPETGP
jgi:vacuolar-type H+-ATPase subunit E/Vma4